MEITGSSALARQRARRTIEVPRSLAQWQRRREGGEKYDTGNRGFANAGSDCVRHVLTTSMEIGRERILGKEREEGIRAVERCRDQVSIFERPSRDMDAQRFKLPRGGRFAHDRGDLVSPASQLPRDDRAGAAGRTTHHVSRHIGPPVVSQSSGCTTTGLFGLSLTINLNTSGRL